MSRKRLAWIAGGVMAACLLIAVSAVIIVRSAWFRDEVRTRIVSAIETATGGRAEIANFDFDWSRLRADVRGFVLHGTEPAGKPPLVSARSIAVGLRIISIFERDVNVQYVDIASPRIYLMIDRDGNTNIPKPKLPPARKRNTIETILDASIGRFNISNGVFEVEGRGSTPFDAHGRDLNARFDYELAGPRYRGNVRMQLADLRVAEFAPTTVDLAAQLLLEKNRIGITSATLRTGASQFELSGSVEDLNAPRASLQYTATVSQNDVARFLETKLLERGMVRFAGNARYSAPGDFEAKGNLNAYSLEYRDSYVHLPELRADGVFTAGPRGIEVSGLRFSGQYERPGRRIPVDGRIANTFIHGNRIDFRGLALAIFGGTFQGEGGLEDLDHFVAAGNVTGFQARRVIGAYSLEELPWDGRASGSVQVDAHIKRNNGIAVSTNLTIVPEAGSAPVNGQLTASYDSRTKIIDLGRSHLELPSSNVSFSGAIGKELRAHFETRELADVLPAIGVKPESVPVRFEKGSAVFDGAVTGPLADPRIAGKLTASGFTLDGKPFDSFSADVLASPANVRADNATLARGALRAQFQFAVSLSHWKPEPANDVFGSATVRNAPARELADVIGWDDAPIAGTIGSAVQLTGSVSSPILQGAFDWVKGQYKDEPFDRFTGNLRYANDTVQLTGGQLTAGPKQVRIAASYHHASGSLSSGRLNFDGSTNTIPLGDIRTLVQFRPGLHGLIQGAAEGTIEIRPARNGQKPVEIESLRANFTATSLEYEGQSIGNARLSANSDGRTLQANLEAGVAESVVRGEGAWKVEGDYPGSASLTFSRLNLARLRDFISPRKSPGPAPYTGSAEGQIRLDGPVLKPEQLKARLTVTSLQLSPAPNSGLVTRGVPLIIRNEGPVVATLANKTLAVESAHLVGRSTDVVITGKAAFERGGLDLRATGRVDLGILEDVFTGVSTAGNVNVNATIRGTFDSPQLGGRAEVQDGSLVIENFPNGLSNANGVILFNGDQATIQSFRGESGGGTVDVSGSVGYARGQAVFNLDLDGKQVRVRYPEGISTVSNARLSLRGTSERSMLTGNVSILRTGINLQSDFSSVLARSAEPVETPPARTGVLGGMNLDVQIETAPDVEVRSSMTQDIAAEANLRLRGTATNPVLQGRVNILQGQVLFLGSKYNISQGSIEFYNPVKVEPVLNIDLETKAKGVDITLTLSGPVKKLNLTPRSDPPLPLNDILSLLATGQAPSSDPVQLAQRSATNLSWQQMGASALLGQALASPVAGRLQRFFGVSRLRIDPTLPGVENNPQARFTVEQQITPDITFTYITVVNSSNPQVVRVEWDFSKQWSVVALREENGQFGLDFYYKRQFK